MIEGKFCISVEDKKGKKIGLVCVFPNKEISFLDFAKNKAFEIKCFSCIADFLMKRGVPESEIKKVMDYISYKLEEPKKKTDVREFLDKVRRVYDILEEEL